MVKGPYPEGRMDEFRSARPPSATPAPTSPSSPMAPWPTSRWKRSRPLADLGVSIEVIDLRSLKPLDWATIEASVKKTSRVLIVHEDNEFVGYGAELAAQVADKAFEWLDAPVRRYAAPDIPTFPYASELEEMVYPESGRHHPSCPGVGQVLKPNQSRRTGPTQKPPSGSSVDRDRGHRPRSRSAGTDRTAPGERPRRSGDGSSGWSWRRWSAGGLPFSPRTPSSATGHDRTLSSCRPRTWRPPAPRWRRPSVGLMSDETFSSDTCQRFGGFHPFGRAGRVQRKVLDRRQLTATHRPKRTILSSVDGTRWEAEASVSVDGGGWLRIDDIDTFGGVLMAVGAIGSDSGAGLCTTDSRARPSSGNRPMVGDGRPFRFRDDDGSMPGLQLDGWFRRSPDHRVPGLPSTYPRWTKSRPTWSRASSAVTSSFGPTPYGYRSWRRRASNSFASEL